MIDLDSLKTIIQEISPYAYIDNDCVIGEGIKVRLKEDGTYVSVEECKSIDDYDHICRLLSLYWIQGS